MWCSKLSQVPEFLQHLFIYHVLCKLFLVMPYCPFPISHYNSSQFTDEKTEKIDTQIDECRA